MKRNYPRFLYSNPQNTKSKGPFIVHTLPPRIIMRIDHDGSRIVITPLDLHTEPEDEDIVIMEAHKWLTSQIEIGEIVL